MKLPLDNAPHEKSVFEKVRDFSGKLLGKLGQRKHLRANTGDSRSIACLV
jgi:hypothetical protein